MDKDGGVESGNDWALERLVVNFDCLLACLLAAFFPASSIRVAGSFLAGSFSFLPRFSPVTC